MDPRQHDLLAVVSHELRTPLGAIAGWVRLLRSQKLDAAKTLHAYDVIENSINTQATLIDDLIDVSRIINSKFQLQTQEVDIEAIIKSVVDALQPTVEEKQVQVFVVPISRVPRVIADPFRLQQVVWNLLSNAIKFTAPGGSVCVELRCDDSCLEICVTDTGKGIEREFLPFVFEPFRQGGKTTRDRKAGLGLGLAIAREIVDLHHGSINAYSEGAGKGATFTVRLPLSANERISPETCSDSSSTCQSNWKMHQN